MLLIPLLDKSGNWFIIFIRHSSISIVSDKSIDQEALSLIVELAYILTNDNSLKLTHPLTIFSALTKLEQSISPITLTNFTSL